MPRILFCCPTPLTATLGASKVYLDAAEGFRRAGWESVVVGPEEVAGGPPGDIFTQPTRLRDYLRRHATEFDVVEFDHHQFPFSRDDVPGGPLLVARSILLAHAVASIRIPPRPGLRPRVGRLMKAWWGRRRVRRVVEQANLTLASADLVNVCNEIERDMLVRHGHSADKICVFPYGLFPERLAAFQSDPCVLPDPPVVGFVGTFDPRKGMCEFPRLIDRLARTIPGLTFRLLGTAGLVPDVDGVLREFPRRLRPLIEVRPRYLPEELPGLLEGVSVGVFPSRIESFGYGVLEMLASGVPVIAYDAPGPHVMLPQDFRVAVGDVAGMAEKLVCLLSDPGRLRSARRWARCRAEEFRWDEIAARTAEFYKNRLERARGPER